MEQTTKPAVALGNSRPDQNAPLFCGSSAVHVFPALALNSRSNVVATVTVCGEAAAKSATFGTSAADPEALKAPLSRPAIRNRTAVSPGPVELSPSLHSAATWPERAPPRYAWSVAGQGSAALVKLLPFLEYQYFSVV